MKKIMVVDDEPDVLAVAVFRFKKLGYEVFTATNGQEALDLLQGVLPDVMLLDLRLPQINGIDVCKKVKHDERLKHIPVILFTASTDNIAANVLEAGADDFLIKPFEPEDLLNKVRNLVGQPV